MEAHSQGQVAPEAATSGTGDPLKASPHTRSQHDVEDEQTSSQLADVSGMAVKGTQPEDMDVDDALTHARLLPHLVRSPKANPTSDSRPVLHSPPSLPVATYESVTARRASPVPDDDDDIPGRRGVGRSRSPSVVEETVALPGSSLETNDGSPSHRDERPMPPRAALKRPTTASPSADVSRPSKRTKLDTERSSPSREEQHEGSDQEKEFDIVNGQDSASRKHSLGHHNPEPEIVSTFDDTSVYPPPPTWRSEKVSRKLKFKLDWRLDGDKDPLPLLGWKDLADILDETRRLRKSAETDL
ncbi:hypothetical protein EWM64_g3034 [Hericium alpestre]|uniref:Uncharacterized protein n=1 Tax=Hericium alpestre TaxID=135208 RepID=A0A4Z0A3E0_9AGAM|nr:hypothetical protein EWM64_g3034 [Hericium alpestre]